MYFAIQLSGCKYVIVKLSWVELSWRNCRCRTVAKEGPSTYRITTWLPLLLRPPRRYYWWSGHDTTGGPLSELLRTSHQLIESPHTPQESRTERLSHEVYDVQIDNYTLSWTNVCVLQTSFIWEDYLFSHWHSASTDWTRQRDQTTSGPAQSAQGHLPTVRHVLVVPSEVYLTATLYQSACCPLPSVVSAQNGIKTWYVAVENTTMATRTRERSPIPVLTGPDVGHLPWSRPTRYHS